MTWYDATGLNLSAFISSGGCPELQPAPGDQVSVAMANFLTQAGVNTGIDVRQSFVLDDDGTSSTTRTGSVQFSSLGDGLRFGFDASLPAAARGSDGANFPVVFNTCVIVGNQAIPMRLVCQPKSTGMLCHQ
jgi:hypothetical protein